MLRRELDAATDPGRMRARCAESIPLGRIARPEDIAAAAVYLASDDSGWVTGTQLIVDGGQTAAFNTGPVVAYTD